MSNTVRTKRKINNTLLLSLLLLRRSKKKAAQRKMWVREIYKQRKRHSVYFQLLNEMRLNDNEKYFNYLRMSSTTFQNLLCVVGPKLNKVYCVREPISAGERLSLTLRWVKYIN